VREGLALGLAEVGDHDNEGSALPAFLDLLDLKGCLVTLDAGGLYAPVAAKVIERGGDFLIALKDNQPTLAETARVLFEGPDGPSPDALPSHTTVDGRRGRSETRRHQLLAAGDLLADIGLAEKWPELRSFGRVERVRRTPEGVTREVDSFITSLRETDLAGFTAATRGHWHIENRLHHVLDVTFCEDACRSVARRVASNLAVLRRITMNLLRVHEPERSVKSKRWDCVLDPAYLETVLRASAL